VGVAVGSIAACVALTGGLALQHLGATNASASKTPTTSQTVANGGDDGFGDDNNSFPTDPFANPSGNNGVNSGSGSTGGGITTSSGS
jgi:hypothetical protein